jgi:hypothetical protein
MQDVEQTLHEETTQQKQRPDSSRDHRSQSTPEH